MQQKLADITPSYVFLLSLRSTLLSGEIDALTLIDNHLRLLNDQIVELDPVLTVEEGKEAARLTESYLRDCPESSKF